jgi:hypothetical protein
MVVADDQVFQCFGLLALDRQQAGAEQPVVAVTEKSSGYRWNKASTRRLSG